MTEPPKETPFKIGSLDDLKRVMTIAKGGDPDAIQAISSFMDLNSNLERSYFPDRKTSLCIAQLHGFGQVYFKNDDFNPFALVADCLSIAYMGYKGFKSKQFVEMTRQTPNLAELQTQIDQSENLGLFKRLMNRG